MITEKQRYKFKNFMPDSNIFALNIVQAVFFFVRCMCSPAYFTLNNSKN